MFVLLNLLEKRASSGQRARVEAASRLSISISSIANNICLYSIVEEDWGNLIAKSRGLLFDPCRLARQVKQFDG
jgi:hypothetical protein